MINHLIPQNIFRFLLLLVLQLAVLNNIGLGSVIVPNILILFVLMLPTNLGRTPMLLLAFVSGLILDICSNILGIQAFSFTMVAMARILFADRILLGNEPVTISRPSFRTVSFQHFSIYSLILLLIYYICYILLESFSFHNVGLMILTIILNVVVSWVLIILYQLLFVHEEE
ncbi:MAG: rod shape-determining protein MreD [Bacteroidales bacterium]|nr:rod shape-determining protein MreD [Bacteroidales bacterium]